MSRTKKGSKGPGAELWSKRPLSGYAATSANKKMSMKMERARAKAKLRKEETNEDE